MRDAFIGSISAIAAPESFEAALAKLGAHVDLAMRYIDHHYYSEAELTQFYQTLYPPRLGDDRDNRKRFGAHAAFARGRSEGAHLFLASGN